MERLRLTAAEEAEKAQESARSVLGVAEHEGPPRLAVQKPCQVQVPLIGPAGIRQVALLKRLHLLGAIDNAGPVLRESQGLHEES